MKIPLIYLLIAVLTPLIGSIFSGVFGTKFCNIKIIPPALFRLITIFLITVSCITSFYILGLTLEGGYFNQSIYTWMSLNTIKLEVGFLVDNLTAIMMCVVTFVSLMVHIYTLGYMKEDESNIRFFSYISLFTFAMLMLVMSNNLLQLFFGWEAVGLVSYLLIGFWFKKESAIFANLKAFLVNRVGDLGFIIGIGLIASQTNSFNYQDIFAHKELLLNGVIYGVNWPFINVVCLCLFIGAMGKSAQFPLHVWLPDSMEGPTPISALIHAATMVTAGIFMVSRMSPIFELSEDILSYIIITGSITALFMGFMGIIQTDIKRVVAYSTLSQLGYMTVALGASAYPLAIFHLVTHAFFKALLFLGAGSVIVGCHHNQNIKYMGNIKKYMPITWITSLIGSLALIGTPFFSGFYSKDSIIEAIRHSNLWGAKFAYICLLIGIFVTAFYSFRMYFLVFHGKERYYNDPNADDHHGLTIGKKPHESPLSITMPLILLSIPSIFIGGFLLKFLVNGDIFSHGITSNTIITISDNHKSMQKIIEEKYTWLSMVEHAIFSLPFLLSISGVLLAWFLYILKPNFANKIKNKFNCIYEILNNKYYLDDFYQAFFVQGSLNIGRFLCKYIDIKIIDKALVHGLAYIIKIFAKICRLAQTGYIYDYAIMMIMGVFIMLGYLIIKI